MPTNQFPPTDPEVAAVQTNNWREHYAYTTYTSQQFTGTVPTDSPEYKQLKEEAFRGFRIPLEVLQNLMEVIETFNAEDPTKQINAVRVYLARETEDPAIVEHPHVYLNPIVDIPSSASGRDMLKLPSGVSSVYNFTTPCPKQCDQFSILYGNQI